MVSIVIPTYNSSNYVLETLESAKAQTYRNIELIVSDDCSTDNTVGICQKWIEENKDRFVRTELLVVEKNTGTASNANRGLTTAKGVWLKFIAGDDILLSTCIQQNVNFINKTPYINFVFSRIFCFGENKCNIDLVSNYFNYSFFSLDVDKQFQYLVFKGNCVPAPTGFIKKDILIELGKFDERIELLEDYSMWIKATKHGNKLYFFDEITVKYRIHENSISQITLSKAYYQSHYRLFIYYIFPHLIKKNPFIAYDRFILLKSKTVSSKVISYIFVLLRITSPYAYYRLFSKIITRS